jgi:hypothetical protein
VILALLLAASAEAAPQYSRARAQYLFAVWAEQHQDVERARTAARAVLFQDPTAAPPRALLARLLPDDPASVSQATELLDAAAKSPTAPASVFTALGRAHAQVGRATEASAAFAEAHARGGGADNDAAWLLVLTPPGGRRLAGAAEVSARWQASAWPGSGGYAARAQGALVVDAESARMACVDALAAASLGEPLAPTVVADRCRAAGLPAVGELALSRLQGATAEALASAHALLRVPLP